MLRDSGVTGPPTGRRSYAWRVTGGMLEARWLGQDIGNTIYLWRRIFSAESRKYRISVLSLRWKGWPL